jgi:hypothetical protein
MTKTKLKLYEFYALDYELNGLVDQQKGEVVAKGLLSENLKFVVKYHLMALADKVAKEKKQLETLKEGIIKKNGKEDKDGQVSIATYILEEDGKTPKEVNPEYVAFSKEWEELLQEEKEVEHFKFTLDHFSAVETSSVYQTFFKLISED